MPPNHFAGYVFWPEDRFYYSGGRSSKWSKTVDKNFNKKLDDFLRREDWAKIWFYLSNSLFFSNYLNFVLFYLFYFSVILFSVYLLICLVCFNCLFCILNKFVVFVSLLVLGFELSFLNKFSVLICLLSSLFFSNKKEL